MKVQMHCVRCTPDVLEVNVLSVFVYSAGTMTVGMVWSEAKAIQINVWRICCDVEKCCAYNVVWEIL